MRTLYIGIDPGFDGAIAFLSYPELDLECVSLQFNDKDLDVAWYRNTLLEKIVQFEKSVIVQEKVQGDPKFGGSPAFNFGKTCGMLKAINLLFTIDHNVSFFHPTPQSWKKNVLEGTAKDKDAAIKFIQQMFPKCSLLASPRCKKPSHDMADASCMSVFGMRLFNPSTCPTSFNVVKEETVEVAKPIKASKKKKEKDQTVHTE